MLVWPLGLSCLTLLVASACGQRGAPPDSTTAIQETVALSFLHRGGPNFTPVIRCFGQMVVELDPTQTSELLTDVLGQLRAEEPTVRPWSACDWRDGKSSHGLVPYDPVSNERAVALAIGTPDITGDTATVLVAVYSSYDSIGLQEGYTCAVTRGQKGWALAAPCETTWMS